MTGYNVVSLFSGAGGLDYGFVTTGRYSVIFANDIKSYAVTTYARNFNLQVETCDSRGDHTARKFTVLECDVERVDFSGLRGLDVDVVLGGAPCQDFSIARNLTGRREGILTRRGRLYLHFVRALAELQPKIFVFENVPGLITVNNGIAYKIILRDFQNPGDVWTRTGGRDTPRYEIVYADVVDFMRLGVPQRRKRLIVVGVRQDLVRDNVKRLLEMRDRVSRVLNGEDWLFGKYPLTTLETFEGRRLDQLQHKYDEIMREWYGVWDEVRTERALRWKREVWDRLTFDVVKDYLLLNNVNSTEGDELEEALRQHERVLRELGYHGVPVTRLRVADGTNDIPRENVTVVERMKRIPPGENYEFVRDTPWGINVRTMSTAYMRLHPLRPAYTVIASTGGGLYGYHYERGRSALTLRERARLQTFPDTFQFFGTKTEIRAMIGEAVPPLFSKRLAEVLAETLDSL
jgi:DNA (cytosine-5)-methyltransferase 1